MNKLKISVYSLLSLILVLTSCLQENKLKQGSIYAFFTQECRFDCYECSNNWKIKFIDEENAELWSHSNTRQYPSCKSEVKYRFENDVVSIKSISNPNVSFNCKQTIIGVYKYKEINGRPVFSKLNSPSCNFSWFKD
jgi:hypothetical protein